MKSTSIKEKIEQYIKSSSEFSPEGLSALLLIDSLYEQVPEDIEKFRSLYSHLDPGIIDNYAEGITFLKIVQSNEPASIIRERLNNYINIKFNYLGNHKSYEENMIKFESYSKIISKVLKDVLEIAKLPQEIIDVLREDVKVENCHDFYEILNLYKDSNDKRTKFEILRKIGLIVILARIKRSLIVDELTSALQEVKRVFSSGLELKKKHEDNYYLWIDENDSLKLSSNKNKVRDLYFDDMKKRSKKGLAIIEIQKFVFNPFETKFGLDILHVEARNKFKNNHELSYTSFIEKIVRKNLEYPNQVHDVLGIKLIVDNESQIPVLVSCLETFIGGTSTRKQEKNMLDKFGKRKLSEYSSGDYYVWKAIYDIALPHPSVKQVNRMIELTKSNRLSQEELGSRLKYFMSIPRDYVVEVQLQDINTYLLSIIKGSQTDHELLKMNQIRANSFYKFFPKEIYQKELIKLKLKILKL